VSNRPTREQIVLAQRLRALREETWPGVVVTQAQLAEAFNLSVPAISSWESTTNPKAPPSRRLAAYARLFATERSIKGDRLKLVDESQLTQDERARRDELENELNELRVATMGRPVLSSIAPPTSTWRFPDGNDITIVCAQLPGNVRELMPDPDPNSPDHVELYSYADLDSLLELHGHIRAVNPENQVNIRLATALTADDYSTHLVVLGGVDWNTVTRVLLSKVDLPVRQVSSEEMHQSNDAYFEVTEGNRTVKYRPSMNDSGAGSVLTEDVAHFYRGRNPFNAKRTVTICNAMYGRGTLGAVRALTDKRFRDRNEAFISQRFAGQEAFSILARVLVVEGQTVTPDWTLPEVRLHTWPAQGAE